MEIARRIWRNIKDRPELTDRLVVLVMLALVQLDTWTNDFVHGPHALYSLVACVMTLPLIYRRRFPVSVGGLVTASYVLQSIIDGSGQPSDWLIIPWLFAIYSMGAHVSDSLRWWAVAVTGAASLSWFGPDDFLLPSVVFGGAYIAGRHVQTRQQLAEVLRAQNETLQREQADLERLAVAEERARIARDLHDLVAHSMSVIAVQAGGERMRLGQNGGSNEEALRIIEDTARHGLTEMRRLVEVLRESESVEPHPSLTRLDPLLQNARLSGLTVEVAVSGDLSDLPASLDLSGYRILQEALTNAAKHAFPAEAELLITRSPAALDLEITNPVDEATEKGSGYGLIGIRERVAAYAGNMECGLSEDIFRLHVRLPMGHPTT